MRIRPLQAVEWRKWPKVPENRDQGIVFNGSVKKRIVAVFINHSKLGYGSKSQRVVPGKINQSKLGFSLYKILFHFKALLRESIILLLPPPTCNAWPVAILLHALACAIYAPQPTPSLYAIYHTILAITISCEGQTRIRFQKSKTEFLLTTDKKKGVTRTWVLGRVRSVNERSAFKPLAVLGSQWGGFDLN